MPVKETHLTDAVFDQLRRAMAADPAGFTALYRDFLIDAWQSLHRLREDVQSRRAGQVRATAHYMRSGSLILGAREVACRAALLEEAAIACEEGKFDGLLDELKMALDEVQVELRERLGHGVLPADDTAA